jgi:hypothetical protein
MEKGKSRKQDEEKQQWYKRAVSKKKVIITVPVHPPAEPNGATIK